MNCGQKRVHVDFSKIRDVPLQQRTTLRALSSSINVSTSTLHRSLKSGDIRCHSNAIKPLLEEENRKSRLQFCLSNLYASSIPHDPIFTGMHNIVHIDEKWFYITRQCEKYYLLPTEEDPLRTCKSKNFIGKVMFLVAVARPRFDADRNEIFSGKIGVFPFVTQEQAKRTSVNRLAGTPETKPITSITRDVVKKFLIEKDNARTHISQDDEDFRRAATQDGFDIRLVCQPANSSDLNVLDLSFFAAIQSLQYKRKSSNIDELIDAVNKTFEDFFAARSKHIFLTLQLCMKEIMRVKGSQQYKIPHINKLMLERRGELPTQIRCDPVIVQEALNYLESG